MSTSSIPLFQPPGNNQFYAPIKKDWRPAAHKVLEMTERYFELCKTLSPEGTISASDSHPPPLSNPGQDTPLKKGESSANQGEVLSQESTHSKLSKSHLWKAWEIDTMIKGKEKNLTTTQIAASLPHVKQTRVYNYLTNNSLSNLRKILQKLLEGPEGMNSELKTGLTSRVLWSDEEKNQLLKIYNGEGEKNPTLTAKIFCKMNEHRSPNAVIAYIRRIIKMQPTPYSS